MKVRGAELDLTCSLEASPAAPGTDQVTPLQPLPPVDLQTWESVMGGLLLSITVAIANCYDGSIATFYDKHLKTETTSPSLFLPGTSTGLIIEGEDASEAL